MIGNPFFYRAADAKRGGIAQDRSFVNLFGVTALNHFEDKIQQLWDLPLILISAPGGGKSSLMRIFSPGALRFIKETALQPERQALVAWMEKLGAFRDGVPYALGVWIRMSDEYHFFDRIGQPGLFRAFINSRILLSAINGICDLHGLERYNDLGRIHLSLRNTADRSTQQRWAAHWRCDNAQVFYEKLAKLEKKISDLIDDPFWQGDGTSLSDSDLWSINLLANLHVTVDGKPFSFCPLVMFDDAHELTQSQISSLLGVLVSRQMTTPSWISLRKQAMTLEQLLNEELHKGVEQGRDYQVIDLEKSRSSDFRKRMLDIAALRVASVASQLGRISRAFEEFISDDREKIFWDHLNAGVAEEIIKKIISISGHDFDKFKNIISEIESDTNIDHIRCRRLRILQILVQREISKPQRTLQFVRLSEKLFAKFEKDSAIIESADLFLANEYQLPYYFGAQRLIIIASFNVNQFLRLAGELFAETMTAIRLGRDRDSFISQSKQHSIITRTAKDFFNEVPRSVHNGEGVSRLLEAIGDMCFEETYRSTAPYAPGVTGTAITMYELELLKRAAARGEEEALGFYQLLQTAIAHNILEPEPHYKCKGKTFLVLNLNRLLCVHFKLPLQRGGFREQKVATLMDWLKNGRRKKKNEGGQQTLW